MAQQMKFPLKPMLALALMSLMVASHLMSTGAEAAKIETFNAASCSGNPTNTFYVKGNTCQTFNDQGAVRISDVSASTRISVHNQKKCKASSQVSQIYGGGCVIKGKTAIRAVWIQG